MDLKKKVEELVKKISGDPTLKDEFAKNPAAVIEKLVGVDLPDEQVNQLVTAIRAKLTADGVGNLLGGLFGKK